MLGIEADLVEKIFNQFASLVFIRRKVMYVYRLANDFADGHTRVKRGRWVLKDYLHLAAVGKHFTLCYIRTVVDDFSCRRFVQAKDGSAKRRLTAARFAHEAERFTLLYSQRYVIDCLNICLFEAALLHGKKFPQALDFYERFSFFHVIRPPF